MLTIECYNGLPSEYESFLLGKYDSFITTCPYIEINYPNHEIYHLLVYRDKSLFEIIVFGVSGNTLTFFNSLVKIDPGLVAETIKYIFEKFGHVQRMEIVASFNPYNFKRSVMYVKSDDYIIDLPTGMEDYLQQLGSSTRQHYRNRKIRLLRDYPGVEFVAKFGQEIDKETVEKIVGLNRNRMIDKGIAPGIGELDKENLYQYARKYGCVNCIKINDVIIAGNISTVLQKSAFAHVSAFDPDYYKYNVGEICAFHLIEICIEKGLSTCHLLWGVSDLKKRLRANPNMLYSYFIYRKYSLDFVFQQNKMLFYLLFEGIKSSKILKPIKDAVKSYRKISWEKNKVKAYV